MNILQPIEITSAMIGAGCTLSEDPTSAWVSGTTYAVGDERHVVAKHRVYKNATAGASSISPELDPTRWVDMRPTNKFAPFDTYVSTKATSTSVDITYPITAKFVNSIALYGLVGSSYVITVKDAVGGSVIWSRSGVLKKHGKGWFNYFFGTRSQVTQLVFFDVPMRPAAEITITISASGSNTRSIGVIALGKRRNLAGAFEGGTESGATAEPISNSYIKRESDGTTTIVRRHSGTDLRCRVFIDQQQADIALGILQDALDIPVACIVTDTEGYSGLSAFGLISSGPVQYATPHAYIDVNVKGMI